MDFATLGWSCAFNSTLILCSTKLPKDQRSYNLRNPQILIPRAAKRNSPASSLGLQKDPGKDLSRILRTEAAIQGIEKKANSKKYNNLWPKAVLEALDEAIRGNQWESALKIFELLRKQHWYEARCQTYTKLIVMLGKCKQPEEATILFEIMQTDGLKATLDVYTALVSAYGQSGFIDKALCIVDDMKTFTECKPDVFTYSILIKCCIKQKCFDLIGELLSEMSYLGINCNTVTYNTLIDGYGKAEMFELMESSLSDMIYSGDCSPDVYTLNSIVGAYGNSGQTEKMEDWYNEFQLMGVRPDIKTFNIMIKSYGNAGVYTKMESVIAFMKNRWFSPTVVTFNIVIEVFGKAGDIEKMDEVFRKMKHQGMKPNAITYCSLVRAYSRAGQLEKVSSILRQVENSDVVLDTPFYNCVISAYGQAGDFQRMSELYMEMKTRNCKPDSITFATMTQAYISHGMIEAAQDLESKWNANENGNENAVFRLLLTESQTEKLCLT